MRLRELGPTAAWADIYSRDMARVASLLVMACAVLVTACTAGHAPPVASGAGTSAQANGRSGQGGTPASLPPVRGAMYAGGGCSATLLLLASLLGGVLCESHANPVCAC